MRPTPEPTCRCGIPAGGTGAEWDESLEMHRQGWSFFLDNLKAFLERGEDRRASAMGMRTPAAV